MKTNYLFLLTSVKRALLSIFIIGVVGVALPSISQEVDNHQEHAHEDEHHHEDHGDREEHETEHSHEEEHSHDDLNEEHASEDDGHDHEEHSDASQIDQDIAEQVGIATTIATQQKLQQTVTNYGTLSIGSEQLSHIRARFPGLITSVKVNLGASVVAGDVLAEVESNDSLKQYPVLAPISGTIVQRHANTGEATDDKILFSIVNLERLWAEFRIYPEQRTRVSAGQRVLIFSDHDHIEGEISHLIPSLDQPYLIARVSLDNQEHEFSPGQMIEGHIVIGEFSVDLAVEKAAVQELEGRSGVFVQDGDTYEFVPLTFGRSDDEYVEVLAGLNIGQRYVNRNSYLIKADIEKSEAEHVH